MFRSLLQHSSLSRFQCISNILPEYYQINSDNKSLVSSKPLFSLQARGMSSGVGLLRQKRRTRATRHYRKAGVSAGSAAGGADGAPGVKCRNCSTNMSKRTGRSSAPTNKQRYHFGLRRISEFIRARCENRKYYAN